MIENKSTEPSTRRDNVRSGGDSGQQRNDQSYQTDQRQRQEGRDQYSLAHELTISQNALRSSVDKVDAEEV